MPETLRIYLPDGPRDRAEAGKHQLVNRLQDLMKRLGIGVEIRPTTLEERLASMLRTEFGLVLMAEPWHARMLVMRRAYLHPFWRIETGAERWHFEVAQRRFTPDEMDERTAFEFTQALRDRKFGPDAELRSQGAILVPMQGELSLQRSFQSASPFEMLQNTIDRAEGRKVLVTLHPNESYSASDYDTLHKILATYQKAEIVTKPSEAYLPECDFVVTQNSAVALLGFMLGKPAVLYGRSDFHHIAANVRDLGVDGAFARAQTMTPEYDRYIAWFLRDNSINAGRLQSTERIHAILRRRGWQI